MRIGLGVGGSSIEQFVEQVRRAADAGFESAWAANIFGLDAITAIAVAGREVPGIELGTAVVPTYPRHPHALAQQALTAHDATGGQFTLGIGLSHQIVIENMFGLSFDKPAAHMREYLAVLLPLLRSGAVSHDGERYRVHATVEQLGPAGGPPVLLAALAPVMLKLAGSVADGTVTWMTGPRTIGDHIAPRLAAAAEEAGRPAPRVVCSLPVAVTEDPDGARQLAAKVFAVYDGLPSYKAMLNKEGAAGPGDVAIVGDDETVAAAVRGLADVGVTEFNAACYGDGDTMRRTTALLAELR